MGPHSDLDKRPSLMEVSHGEIHRIYQTLNSDPVGRPVANPIFFVRPLRSGLTSDRSASAVPGPWVNNPGDELVIMGAITKRRPN
jgi:hypothetical protein